MANLGPLIEVGKSVAFDGIADNCGRAPRGHAVIVRSTPSLRKHLGWRVPSRSLVAGGAARSRQRKSAEAVSGG